MTRERERYLRALEHGESLPTGTGNARWRLIALGWVRATSRLQITAAGRRALREAHHDDAAADLGGTVRVVRDLLSGKRAVVVRPFSESLEQWEVVWDNRLTSPTFNSRGAAQAYADILNRGQRMPEFRP